MTAPAKSPAEHTDLARELRDDYPAIDVTTAVFGDEFAGVACCVIPQDRVLAVISALEGRDALVKALEEMIDEFGSREHKDCDCRACDIVRRARLALTTARTPADRAGV